MFRNLPNALTVSRLVLVPFVWFALITGNFSRALFLLLAAGVTDALDGFLARRLGSVSRIGAYLDPVGDKLLLVSSYIALAIPDMIPKWLMWLVLGRDGWILLMVAIAFLFTRVRRFAPTVWGKLSTMAQIATALLVIAGRAYDRLEMFAIEPWAILATAALTAWSGLHYSLVAVREIRAARYKS